MRLMANILQVLILTYLTSTCVAQNFDFDFDWDGRESVSKPENESATVNSVPVEPSPAVQTESEPETEYLDSMELCPFTIEVYPETLHVGDILYLKMSFENKSDMITWALPRAINILDMKETYIVSFCFQDDKTGIQYPWKFQGGYGHYWPRHDVWQPIKPGEKGRTQYLTLGFRAVKDRKTDGTNYSDNYAKYTNFYRFASSLHTSLSNNCLNVMQKYGAEGRIMVTLRTRQGGTAEAPINKTITVTSPKITIIPRPEMENERIHNFYLTGNIFKYRGYGTLEAYQLVHNEFPQIVDQTTPGTLRNLLQMHLYFFELFGSYRKHSDKPATEVLAEITQWLDTLPEIERNYLKQCVVSRRNDGYEYGILSETEKEIFDGIFGKPRWEQQKEPLDLTPWNGRNPYGAPKLHPSNKTDDEPQGGGYG